MSSVFYPMHPARIFWTGISVLGGALIAEVTFLVFWVNTPPATSPPLFSKKKEFVSEKSRLFFSFNLNEAISFPLPRIESELTFSFDPPRPDGRTANEDLFVRLKQSAQSKRVALPCRLDLRFDGGVLKFAEQESPFWLELEKGSEGVIRGVAWVETVPTERFTASIQACPLRGVQEFAEGSPFRKLAEARWLGRDLFVEKYGGEQPLRIAMSGQPNLQTLNIREFDWIVWRNDCWTVGALSEANSALARVESVDAQNLILEGWDGEVHIRLSLPSPSSSPFKMRAEELFTSVRVRSEKQISCMLEKQCLILRTGDWVLKSNGRWKALRKKEEKEAYRLGKMSGELFVFDKIESKQGQKFIAGFLFNAEKSQVVPVDLAAHKHPVRKESKEK